MARSVWDAEVQAALDGAKSGRSRRVCFDGELRETPPPTPSPEDWRDHWMYLALTDRFNDPQRRLTAPPYDVACDHFRGGTWRGITEKLPYLRRLGVSALWLSPVLKNTRKINGADDGGAYHGYCTQDFLAVEARFATDAGHAETELRTLVDEAHRHAMPVVLDIALVYTGDVFAYNGLSSQAPWSATPYPILWRDANGDPHPGWTDGGAIGDPPADAAVFPAELRHNAAFRRQGDYPPGAEGAGDLYSLKQLLLDDQTAFNALTRAYQFVIAKYDVDAFRIDALKHVDLDAARIFANAIREYCLAIGKKNFLIFGEVWGDEKTISAFIGRDPGRPDEPIGVDAALDFPLNWTLFHADLPRGGVAKGERPPVELVRMYSARKEAEEGRVASHAEATSFFVTFMDNHDLPRYFHDLVGRPHGMERVTLALTCLFTLQGIPCLYYGTEQGLSGCRPSAGAWTPSQCREPLWELPGAFDMDHPFFTAIQALGRLRERQPALRYGRQYFRQLSGDGATFGYSPFAPGVLAYSRILGDTEILVVANTHPELPAAVSALVDPSLNPTGSPVAILYSNVASPTAPGLVEERAGPVTFSDAQGAITYGPCRSVRVTLRPAEAQVLALRPAPA